MIPPLTNSAVLRQQDGPPDSPRYTLLSRGVDDSRTAVSTTAPGDVRSGDGADGAEDVRSGDGADVRDVSSGDGADVRSGDGAEQTWL